MSAATDARKQPRFIRCASVSEKCLRDVFERDLGWGIGSVGHFSVSQDLTFELQRAGVLRALPLGAVVDALEFALMRDPAHETPPSKFPGPPSSDDAPEDQGVPYPKWLESLMEWYDKLNGCRIRLDIAIREIIEETLRNNVELKSSLVQVFDSEGAVAAAIRRLVELGFRPEHLAPRSEEGKLAKSLWLTVESMLSDSKVLADYLFIDHQEPGNQRDSLKAREQLEALVRQGFGFGKDEPIRLAYHGLYFYSPLQWAIIELLSHLGVDQVFVVHDDGVGAQFEIWRRFFFESHQMGEKALTFSDWEPVDDRATYFAESLRGGLGNTPEGLQLFAFPAVTDLARHVREHDVIKQEKAVSHRQVFAAGAGDVNRKIARFNRLSGEVDSRSLLGLPIGRFLLALQEVVRVSEEGDDSGFDFETLLHLVDGGYFNTRGQPGDRPVVELLDTCRVYFGGSRTIEVWRSRLNDLAAYYEPRLAGTGDVIKQSSHPRRRMQVDGGATSDHQFITDAVTNHLRRAPWLDLTQTEWESLKKSLAAIFEEVEQLRTSESVQVRTYIDGLVAVLSRHDAGARVFGENLWTAMEKLLNALPEPPELNTRVTRVSEILPVILGKQLKKTAEQTFADSRVKEGLVNSLAAPLRSLESCGFAKKPKIHVTNLSDAVFPYRPQLFAWPFRRDEIVVDPSSIDQQLAWRIRIIDELDRSGGLGDIYLLWLATNGSDGDIKLTWIEENGFEKLNPSPIIALMLEVPKTSAEVKEFAGGFKIDPGSRNPRSGDQHNATLKVLKHDADTSRLATKYPLLKSNALVNKSALKALASAAICGRRTALHWYARNSVGYRTRWQLGILYGNLLGIKPGQLSRKDSWNGLLDRLWCWMTPSEREKTAARSSIHQRKVGIKTAEEEWLLTLEGAKDSGDKDARKDRLSKAYRLALSVGEVPDAIKDHLFGDPLRLLPDPHIDDVMDDDPDDTRQQMWYLCSRCPVSDRCLKRHYPPEK